MATRQAEAVAGCLRHQRSGWAELSTYTASVLTAAGPGDQTRGGVREGVKTPFAFIDNSVALEATAVNIYLDETGYTGQDILNPDQPVYALASTNLSDAQAFELARRCFPTNRAAELKHSALASRRAGQEQIVDFIRALREVPGSAALTLAHKEFVLLALIIDFWVEPALRLDGINLYERGANIGLANVTYLMLKACLSPAERRDLLGKGQTMLRTKTVESHREFGVAVNNAIAEHPTLDDCLGLVVTADWRLGGYSHLVSLPDRLTDLGTYGLMESVAHWRDRAEGDPLSLIHDQSSALAREQHVWDLILSPEVPETVVGQDRRLIRFPLNVREIGFGDSRAHVQLQLADVLAGAAASYHRNRFNWEPTYRREYVQRLEQSGISDLVINIVWPTAAVTPEQLGTDGEVVADAADFIGGVVGRSHRQTRR